MPEAHEKIEEYWSKRGEDLAKKAKVIAETELPLALKRHAELEARLSSAVKRQKELAEIITKLRAELRIIPMPADSSSVLHQWEDARREMAQVQNATTESERDLAIAASVTSRLQSERRHYEAEAKHAEAQAVAAKLQKQHFLGLLTALKSPSFATAQNKAVTLLAAGGPVEISRQKIDGALPAEVAAAVTPRRNKGAGAKELVTELPSFATTRLADAGARVASLSALIISLTTKTTEFLDQAQSSLDYWGTIGTPADGALKPVTTAQASLLTTLTTAPVKAALAKLKTAEGALTMLDDAEAALALVRLNWWAPGESGYQKDGPDDAAAIQKVETSRNDFNQAKADVAASLTEAQKVLAHVPDLWRDISNQQAALEERLRMLEKPLGEDSPAKAVAAFNSAVAKLKTEIEKDREFVDASAKYARSMVERRAVASAIASLSFKRSISLPGGLAA